MRWYHLIDRCTRPCALGYAGVASTEALGESAEKVEELSVRNVIGKSHDLAMYLCRPGLMASAWDSLEHSPDSEKAESKVTESKQTGPKEIGAGITGSESTSTDAVAAQ